MRDSQVQASQARAVMEDVLGGPSTRGAPDLAGRAGARDVAPVLLDALARLYGVRHWSVLEFQRAYANGALAAWRPGSIVRAAPCETRVSATSCPIGDEADASPARCARCQSLHLEVARVALGARSSSRCSRGARAPIARSSCAMPRVFRGRTGSAKGPGHDNASLGA